MIKKWYFYRDKSHFPCSYELSDSVFQLRYYPFLSQAAITKQKIKEQEQEVLVVERQKQIEIQEQEILRREKELDSKIRKPAEAEKYRCEKIAEANRQRVILEAEAEAEAIAMRGTKTTMARTHSEKSIKP